MRRASTMTRAPSAPCDRSCHMKPNRSWPGVPNRYSLRSSSMVMQPKSNATVVDVFAGTSPVRSICAANEVIGASVVSGGISEITDSAVGLPTPKPPAMTIFTGIGGRCLRGCGSADSFESTDHPLDQVPVLRKREARALDDEVPQRGEVGDEHPGHADVQPEPGGYLGHGHRRRTELDDFAVLERQPAVRGLAQAGGQYLGPDLQRVVDRLRPAGREQVRPQPRDGAVVPRTGDAVVLTAPDREIRAQIAGRRLVDAVPILAPRGQPPRVNLSSSIRRGVSTPLARLANSAISNATVPRLACLVASTPSAQPTLMVHTSR